MSGLNAEQIYIHNCFIGGGFGRKSANDEMVQAIAIAKAVQRPVKLIWTREEDMRRDRFRPQAVTRFKAGLDANGMPVAWSMRNVIGSIFASLGMHRPGLKGPEPMAVAGLANNAYNVPNTPGERWATGFAAFPRDAAVRLGKVRAFAPGEMAFLSGA